MEKQAGYKPEPKVAAVAEETLAVVSFCHFQPMYFLRAVEAGF